MNWDAIGAVGEILGAIAVFSSLIYLSIQIRSQIRESRLNAVHDIAGAMREIIADLMSVETTPLLIKANEDWDLLSEEEAIRFVGACGRFFLVWEEAFFQHAEGRLPDRNWDSIAGYCQNGMGNLAIQRAWELRKRFFDDEFVQFVDAQESVEYKVG